MVVMTGIGGYIGRRHRVKQTLSASRSVLRTKWDYIAKAVELECNHQVNIVLRMSAGMSGGMSGLGWSR